MYQVDKLKEDIDHEGLDYFIENYTSLAEFEQEHGRLPHDVRQAWRALERAISRFREAVEHGGSPDLTDMVDQHGPTGLVAEHTSLRGFEENFGVELPLEVRTAWSDLVRAEKAFDDVVKQYC